MAPFATAYSWPSDPRLKKALIAAKLNKLEVAVPDFTFGTDNKEASFLAKFPLGKVPALETHGSEHLCLAESGAIAAFLADAGPARDQLLGANEFQRAKVTQWLLHTELEISPNVFAGIRPKVGRAEYDPDVEAKALTSLDRIVAVIESTLAGGQSWLVPGTSDYSLADLTAMGSLAAGLKLWLDKAWRDRHPATMAWFARLLAVPAVHEAYDDFKFVDEA